MTSAADAANYHLQQGRSLRDAGVEMLSAMTMTSSREAIGVARVARTVGLPISVSFTVETDGRLPSGETLQDAIEAVDADTAPDYFALNCAHPSHFHEVLAKGGSWTRRIRSIRANASSCSHAELDTATELDSGDPEDLGNRYRRLRSVASTLNVLGGCCGTDLRHLRAIRDAWI
jgi:homocysteine S-methyltransferase